jgi:hypothetical protein
MEKFMRVLNNFLPFAIFPAVTRGIKNLLSLYPSLQLKLFFEKFFPFVRGLQSNFLMEINVERKESFERYKWKVLIELSMGSFLRGGRG